MSFGHAGSFVHDLAVRGPRPVGAWLIVCVFAVLILDVLSIHFLQYLHVPGFASVLWTERHLYGLSLHAIVTIIDVLLLFFIGVDLASGRLLENGRFRWPRLAASLVALAVVAGTQCVANGWRSIADEDLERTLALDRDVRHRIRRIESEIARLDDHPWAGCYVGRLDGRELRYRLAPESGFAFEYRGPGYRADASNAARLASSSRGVADLGIEKGRLEVDWFRIRGAFGYTYLTYLDSVVVEWGERRYLFDDHRLFQRLKAEAQDAPPPEIPVGRRILLRDGDESKPLFGVPVIADF